ncbi:hypothetical protein NC653_017286 [Populus alba x Populus x berolinensis]|uniref:Uncharacterized protein n=1 Tax=Populus alba x Populus x berolinensis TaxID=444605 RepID=A0AAD6W0E5_9ROSI|nr:hypothetical protein NC653_017286 [Populus alba x Populus x berolinensis]
MGGSCLLGTLLAETSGSLSCACLLQEFPTSLQYMKNAGTP